MARFQHAFVPTFSSSEPEEKTIQRLKRGDQTAIEELFHKYYSGLCRFTLRLTNSKEDVEDLVQDIFVKIWLNREKWNPKGSIKAYLFRAARNQALNFLKSRRVKDTVIVETDDEFLQTSYADPAEEMIGRDISASIDKAIEKLPQKSKLAFTLNRQEGLSYSEIADVLNISEKTVENQIARALKSLRKDLADFLR